MRGKIPVKSRDVRVISDEPAFRPDQGINGTDLLGCRIGSLQETHDIRLMRYRNVQPPDSQRISAPHGFFEIISFLRDMKRQIGRIQTEAFGKRIMDQRRQSVLHRVPDQAQYQCFSVNPHGASSGIAGVPAFQESFSV